MAANAAAAAHLMGHALAGSRLGLAGTAAAIAAASVRLPAAAEAASAAFSSSQVLQQQLSLQQQQEMQHQQPSFHGDDTAASGGGGGSTFQDEPPQQPRGPPAPASYGSSGRAQSVGGGFRSALNGMAGPSAASNDVPRRTTAHMGGESWTSRESYTLVALPRSEEMLRAGALQARFTTRLEPHHEKDLTHGFVDRGTWNELNLMGNTKSPVRRPLSPAPLPASDPVAAARAASFPPQQTHAVGDRDYGYGYASRHGVPLDGGLPPLGQLLHDRAGRIASAREQLQRAELEALHGGGAFQAAGVGPAGGGTLPLSPRATARLEATLARRHLPAHPESAALDAFDQSRRAHAPVHWPVKVLRAKIRDSGVAERVGMHPPEVLARASRAQLLAAWERVPAARHIIELMGAAGSGGAVALAMGAPPQHPLSVFADSSRSLLGAVGMPTNVAMGRTSALEVAIRGDFR